MDLARVIIRLARIGCCCTAIALPAMPAGAQTAAGGVALVFGNGTYPGLPQLPGCLASAHAVAAALHRLDFTVVEQEDGSAGVMDAALSRFTQALHQAGSAPAVIYACGYGAAFNGRPFLLPVSATISRPADLLTQGLLARSLLDTVSQGNASGAVALLDIVLMPGSATDSGLPALLEKLPPQLALLAAPTQPQAITPTPTAAALIAALQAAQQVTANGVLQAVKSTPGIRGAAEHPAATQAVLLGAPALPAPAKPSPSAPSPAATPPATLPSTASHPPAASVAAPASALPDDAQMTDADRRRVQTILERLGYYDGKIDGVFGPDSRAAIRRWQHEVHAPMTGMLTAAQANQLAGP